MNEFLYYYLIFAISGGLLSVYKLLFSVRRALIENGRHDHVYVTKPTVTLLVWFVVSAVIAPLMIWPLLDDSSTNRFIKAIVEEK